MPAGGAVGAITDPKNPLKGAEFGALGGGITAGIAPIVSDVTGFGAAGSEALAGAIGGGVSSAITGRDPLTGALIGGAGGALSGAISGTAPTYGTPPSGGPVGSATSTAAPASVPLGTAGGDVTAGVNAGGGLSDYNAGFQTGFNATSGQPVDFGAGSAGGAAPPTIGTSLSAGTPTGAVQNLLPTGEQAGGALGGGGAGTAGAGLPSGGGNFVSTPDIPAGSTAPVGTVQAPNIAGETNLGSLATATPSIPTPSIGSQIGSFVKDNSWLLPAGALGIAALESQKSLPGEAQLNASAQNLTNLASTNENYLQTGTLPPGVQQGIDRASAAATASIRSQYASTIGSGTSSAEQQDIAAVGERAAVDGANIAVSLLQQGVSEQGMADQLYLDLMNNALQQDQALGNALGAFAGALVPATLLSKAA